MSETLIGLVICLMSSCGFGSMFVILRGRNLKDGIFVQFIMSCTIFFVGFCCNVVSGFPAFQPLAMLGGALWTIGNLTAVPIINILGIGIGVLVWCCVSCLVGWSIARFGLLGVKQAIPYSPSINYLGVLCVIVGGVLFSFVRPTVKSNISKVHHSTFSTTSSDVSSKAGTEKTVEGLSQRSSQPIIVPKEHVVSPKQRLIGILLAVGAGLCYGTMFVPVIYIQSHPTYFINAPKSAFHYAFSQFTGILVTSFTILVLYLLCTRNRPFINPTCMLPAILSGILWVFPCIGWFFANDMLSQAISYPILSTLPGVIATLWSVFYFKEIAGRNKLLMLTCAVLMTVSGTVLVAVSKDKLW